MDELNFLPNIMHHYRAYGGWSFALQDYYDMGMTRRFDDPAFKVCYDSPLGCSRTRFSTPAVPLSCIISD
jgi:PhoPQ-activated pathogenicity-related protein